MQVRVARQLECRNIIIACFDLKKGEQTAQAYDIA